MTDHIRALVQQVDPIRSGAGLERMAATPPSDRLERIMSTSITERPPASRRSVGRLVGAAAGAVIVAAVAWLAFGLSDLEPALELTLPGSGGPMASCLPVSAETLSDIPLAFEGTVVSFEDEAVILTVDHWYRGASEQRVRLEAISDMDVMISPIDFEVGGQYLITATDRRVNYCGYSAESTPELRAVFSEGFQR